MFSVSTQESLHKTLASLRLSPALGACALALVVLVWIRTSPRRLRTTQLRGPPSESFFYGVGDKIFDASNPGDIYEAWAREYGPAFEVPSTLGSKRLVLCDPKAIAHFYAKETWTYIQIPMSRKFLKVAFGKGLIWANGESHKRQRRSLAPAFSVAAVRQMTSIFYDSAYKAKSAWDALIESGGRDDMVIDVQEWMNNISLDSIGLAGFSHNFGSLEGKRPSIAGILDAFNASPRDQNKLVFLLAQKFPFLLHLPTPRAKLLQSLNNAISDISNDLLARTQKELELGVVGGKEEKSIIGLLVKGANGRSEFPLTKDEVMSQMKVILVAGYDTTSVSLTWALLELSRNPDVQTKLRNELLEHGTDPTYDQLYDGLPYLDAVVHEILRVHPPVVETVRMAIEDDVVPLSEPVRTTSGEIVDNLTVARGTLVTVPIELVNRSAALWGDDAKVFRPSRWLPLDPVGIPARAREVQGHRHLLTFVDGPRRCLGKEFALTEFKAVLAVLVKYFVFALRDDGAEVEIAQGFLRRPKMAGEAGCKLPLRVQPYVAG